LTVRQDFPEEGLTLAVDRIVLATTRMLASTAAAPRLATHPAVRVVKDVLDRDYARRWTLSAMAEQVGLAPTYLAGLFAAEVGQPPHRYLTERRIERAKQLLTTSDLTITAIAIDLGFGSSQHFARAFRQAIGRSPTGYRREPKSV
jgi:AraC family transcriptional regulator